MKTKDMLDRVLANFDSELKKVYDEIKSRI